jgi:hypothetical protein
MMTHTSFHLDTVRPLPSLAAEVGRRHVGRLLLIGSEYKAFGLREALDVLAGQRGIGEALVAPELVTSPEPVLFEPASEGGRHDVWLLHTGVLEWRAANGFAERIKAQDPEARVVLLSDDRRAEFNLWRPNAAVDRVWVWQGQPDGLLALIWLVQDELNAADEMAAGLPLMLLVEDKPVHYSSFVPRIYREVVEQTFAIVGSKPAPNELQRYVKMRPRVLLAETFEQALRYVAAYHENLLGLLTDLQFPAARELHPRAGLILAQATRCLRPSVPIIVHTTNPSVREQVAELQAHFLYKRSDSWLREVRRMLLDYLGFGDFIFRDEQERELARAATIRELRDAIAQIPLESFVYHGRRYHFSTWLYIHGAHELARQMRPLGGGSGEDVRALVLEYLDAYLSNAA